MRVEDLESIRVKLASPEEILSWSHGEVTKPETINYRTQRAEKDGLFCEKIFGPEKDYQCYCGKYKGIRYKGLVCDRCGVEITRSEVRRERMGHIKLAIPCSHIWFLKGIPSRMSMVLDIPQTQLESVIYYASYIVTKVDTAEKKRILEEIENEYQQKIKDLDKAKNEPHLKLEDLNKLKNKAREEVLSIKPLKIISEIEYRNLISKYGPFFEAETGAEPLRKIFEKINLKREIEKLKRKIERGITGEKNKELKRLRFLRDMDKAGIRPEWMFLTVIPVLPPDLRPTVQLDGGRYASSDLNDLYRRVINRNNRLKYLLEIKAPDVIIRNEKRMLQEAVDALVDNSMRKGELTTRASSGGRRILKSLADALKGKRGRFRQNLLGKRVDYSGRSVIVVGPELKLNQCGIPKKMALELFKPFVIGKLLEKELAYNVQGAVRLIEEETDEVWAALEEVVKNRAVLLNRAPTLHRLGIQAFYPLLIEGEAIQLHPMVCKAFNADFDGDQMAVHLPLSKNAQKEAKEIMLPSYNLLKPASGTPIATLYQDIVLGCYSLTKIEDRHSKDAPKKEAKWQSKIFADPEEALLALELNRIKIQEKIKVQIKGRVIETSAGRIIFNRALPKDFPYQNRLINIDALNEIASQIIEKYSSEETQKILDNIKDLGFKYSTLSGITWGMDDLVVPPQKPEIIERAKNEVITIENYYKKGLLSKEERRTKIIEIWTKAKSEIEKLVPETLPKDGPVFTMVDSGSRGGWTQPVQMSGMKGLVINPAGEIIELPVISSYKEGLTVLEYFISTHGARKGTADTALRTSSAGYLTRRLIDVAHGVFTRESDCGDRKGIEVYLSDAKEANQDYVYKIVGRYCLEEIKHPKTKKIIVKAGEIIDWKKAKKIKEAGVEKVRVRSPLSCKGKEGICQKCYGWDMAKNKPIQEGQAIGIVAAQAIGEPGTQLTLRTFHTGGVAGSGDITSGLPRVQELFEARVPGGKAEISPVDGKVLEITKNRIIKIKTNMGQKKKIVEYKIPPNLAISVKPGEKIKKGQPLCEGNLDLRELFRTSGKEAAQRYIIKEIQKVYAGQGAIIHDKHIEVIVSQMFSRLKITDPGDSEFLPGEIVSKIRFSEVNKELRKEKKKPAKGKQILLGITPVALTTDSFLSAASFQQTHRVLIKACLKGQEDKLRGLKENVIIGKLIPVGTGFKK
ncbi:DNA-directed RNA polymerase subunit beta' [bacterium]|nr:DNA-directed RNA polymerase subunit beta' [bacterium]